MVCVDPNRESGVRIEQIASDFGVYPITLQKWMRRADIDEGTEPGSPELRALNCAKPASGSGCWSMETRSFGGRRPICRGRIVWIGWW